MRKGMHHCIPCPTLITLITLHNEKLSLLIYINMSKIVTEKVSEEDIQEARRLEDDPLKILALIDIIFMNEDKSKIIPS